MGKFLIGLILGLIAIPAGVYFYFSSGTAPVATSAPPMPLERRLMAGMALHARMDKEVPKSVPIAADEAAYMAGAQIYKELRGMSWAGGAAADGDREGNVSEASQVDGWDGSIGRSGGGNLLEGIGRNSHDGDAGIR